MNNIHGPNNLNETGFVYSKPINVYFESTIACDLSCKHCRAEAIPERSPFELSTEEVKELLRDIKTMGSHLVVSGGDPLKRDDLFEILAYAKELRIPTALTPTTSPLATFETIQKAKELGVYALGISLDGATEESQDTFRGVSGTFENSMNVLGYARDLGISVQVNSTCTADTISEFEKIYELLASNFATTIKRWSIFCIVPVGRGKELDMPTHEQLKSLFEFLYSKSHDAPFRITTTEAPFYRIYSLLKQMEAGKSLEEVLSRKRTMGLGVRDGNGVIFVSHVGTVYPSGFLTTPIGNVKEQKLSSIYRDHEKLAELRNPDKFKGKCGSCPFRWMCGGSRARAYAVTNDYLETDPLCPFFEDGEFALKEAV